MAISTWPGTLPTSPQKGYNEILGAMILRTPMDAGPAKQRLRASRPDQLNVQYIMTTAQLDTLQTFISSTINYTRRFNYTHPRKNTSVEVRIVPQQDGALYSSTYLAPGYWQIGLQLEVLP